MAATTPPQLEPKDPEEPRRFLVCYDDSPEARCAVEHAVSLARADKEDEVLIVMGAHSEDGHAASLTALSGAKALGVLYNRGIVINIQVLVSHDVPRAICDAAREIDADYMVVGCRGANLSRKFLGSTSKKITKLAPCPVILCRTNPSKKKTAGKAQTTSTTAE